MPEGDVVRRTADTLGTVLVGHRLEQARLQWPSLATTDLTGREVLASDAVGKHLLLRLGPRDGRAGDELTLHSHLRMEGSWWVLPRDTPRAARALTDPGVRAVLAVPGWVAIGFRLGMLDVLPTARESECVGHLGPDVLLADPRVLRDRVLEHPDRTIGEVLLDQRVIAGVGTFYLGEVCFLRGVTPWTPVRDVRDPGRLVLLVQRLMRANLDRAVQSTTGDLRPGREAYVHARSGRPCRRCGAPVRVAALGQPPRDRVAFWCPSCQRGPTPTDTGRPARPLGSTVWRRGNPR